MALKLPLLTLGKQRSFRSSLIIYGRLPVYWFALYRHSHILEESIHHTYLQLIRN